MVFWCHCPCFGLALNFVGVSFRLVTTTWQSEAVPRRELFVGLCLPTVKADLGLSGVSSFRLDDSPQSHDWRGFQRDSTLAEIVLATMLGTLMRDSVPST